MSRSTSTGGLQSIKSMGPSPDAHGDAGREFVDQSASGAESVDWAAEEERARYQREELAERIDFEVRQRIANMQFSDIEDQARQIACVAVMCVVRPRHARWYRQVSVVLRRHVDAALRRHTDGLHTKYGECGNSCAVWVFRGGSPLCVSASGRRPAGE